MRYMYGAIRSLIFTLMCFFIITLDNRAFAVELIQFSIGNVCVTHLESGKECQKIINLPLVGSITLLPKQYSTPIPQWPQNNEWQQLSAAAPPSRSLSPRALGHFALANRGDWQLGLQFKNQPPSHSNVNGGVTARLFVGLAQMRF